MLICPLGYLAIRLDGKVGSASDRSTYFVTCSEILLCRILPVTGEFDCWFVAGKGSCSDLLVGVGAGLYFGSICITIAARIVLAVYLVR